MKTPEGTLNKAGDGLIIVTGKDGKERTVSVAPDAIITLNGAPCKLENLQAGTRVKLTPKRGENRRPIITQIEASTP
jgi:hypothetical protein